MHRIYRRFLEEMSDLPWDRKTSSGEKLETVKTAFGPLFPLVQETVRKKLDMVVPPIIKERQVQKQLKEAVAEKLSVLTNPLEVLKKAQAPEHLVSLGFPKTMIREAFLFARFLRERATILDLLDQIGLLEEYVDWVLKENPADSGKRCLSPYLSPRHIHPQTRKQAPPFPPVAAGPVRNHR
jgi:hypothetical protein